MNARRVFIPIMGFTERTRRVTGIERIWQAVGETSGPDAWIIHPQRWNLAVADLAALIARNTDQRARIVIVGHSWGIGWGAMRLAKSLGRVLRPRIRVPSNVRRIHAFVQRRSIPSGHGFRTAEGTFVKVWVVDVPHGWVDELPAFRDVAVGVWKRRA